MVILAAAALTAAGVGVYRGGKAAAEDVGKKLRRGKMAKARTEERDAEAAERARAREAEHARLQSMSVTDRVARFKKRVPTEPKNKGGLLLFRKSQTATTG